MDDLDRPDCSVVISTWNRRELLAGALTDLTTQQTGGLRIEAFVVDNASTDGTSELVQQFAERAPWLHPLYEARSGPASGRNAGIARASGRVIAFTDDDNRLAPDWVAQLVYALDRNPDVDAVAGRIVPHWSREAPSWLTRDHWVGPLALQDYGDTAFVIDAKRPLALSTANLAIRRTALERIGPFAPHLERAEDTELLVRLWQAGGRCLYVPDACVAAVIQPERMTKRYHRTWHFTNGEWTARFDLAELIDRDGSLRTTRAESPRLCGVPSYVVRELASAACKWVGASVVGSSRALVHEHRTRFLWGYARSRYDRHRRTSGPMRLKDLGAFTSALLRRKLRGGGTRTAETEHACIGARIQPPTAPTQNPSSSH